MRALQPSPQPGGNYRSPVSGQHAGVKFGGPSISQRREQSSKTEENADGPIFDEVFLTTLANYLETAWERNKRAKLEVEQRGLKSMRQRRRQYEADVYAAIQSQGGSEHYDGLTATKCRAAESWILDVLAPAGDRPWDIEPTPVPDINPAMQKQFHMRAEQAAIREAIIAQEQAGMDLTGESLVPLIDMVAEQMEKVYKEEVEDEAQERARAMADTMDDQFQEGNFHPEFVKVIRDFVTFPAAFMLGPVFRRRRVLKYKQMGGKWLPQIGSQVVQEYEWVSFFDVYPEDDSTGVQDGDLFVRRRISSKELSSFKGVPGYDNEAIDAVLAEYGRGGYRRWTAIDSARSHAEGRSDHQYESNKIDMLRFWGSVQGQWLIDHVSQRGTGLNVDSIDPWEYYELDCIKIGPYIIRAIINPDKLGKRPLSKACYEEVPGSFWGNGVPDLIRDEQNACNAMARSIVNNTALSSGPVYERNVDRTAGDDGRLYPLKEFRATEDQMASNTPALRFYNIPNNTNQMIEVWQKFMDRADENSGVPAYAHGSEDVGGAGNTASGLSMLMSSSSKLLRMAIYNLDLGVVETVVTRTYHHNMLFSSNESIKGDLKIVPKGATVLLIREQMAARQGEFANMTKNPIDYMLMTPAGRQALLKNLARNHNLNVDEIFPKDVDEIQEAAPGGGAAQQQGMGGEPGQEAGPTMDRGQQPTMDAGGRPLADYQKQ